MARSRKSRSGGVVVTLVIVGLTLLAAIPNEVFMGFALPAATATVICFYFYSQYKKAKSAVNKPESPRQTPRRAVRVSRKPAKGLTRTSRRTIAEDTLVSAGAALTPSYSEFKLPNAPRGLGAASWVPHGQSISVSGLTIPGGMLYVGTSLPTPSCRTADKKSGGSETKRCLRRIFGVCGHGDSQEPIAKSPAWCGALSA